MPLISCRDQYYRKLKKIADRFDFSNRKKKKKDIGQRLLMINRKIKFEIYGCCEICGSRLNLQIHHIHGTGNGHELKNLQLLCIDCHSKMHGRRIPPKFVIRKEIYETDFD